MAGALAWPVACQQAARSKLLGEANEVGTLDLCRFAGFIPRNRFIGFMNRAGEYGLGTFDLAISAFAADPQLEQGQLAERSRRVLELYFRAMGRFVQTGAIKPV